MLPEPKERFVSDVDGQRKEPAVGCERAVSDETMQVGVEVDQGAKGLDGKDAAGNDIFSKKGAVDFHYRWPGKPG